MMNYSILIRSLENNPRDIITRPLINRKGKWFYAYVKDGCIMVTRPKAKTPECSISKPRTLRESECEKMYDLYMKRKHGQAVSKEAGETTVNQVYWYGIFADLGL